jgi:hypothetical protein
MAPGVAACRALGKHPTLPNGDGGKALVLSLSGDVRSADLEAELRKLTDQWIAAVPMWADAALKGEPNV